MTGPSTEHRALDQAVLHRDLILVTGKGGVGKSTLVAALARLAARRRGGAVAVELSAHPRLGPLIGNGAQIEAVNLELEKALPLSLGRMLHVPAVLGAVLGNRILRLFIRASPAAAEMILLDELFELVAKQRKRSWPVIVDLPATGHAVSFLDTPRSVHRMLRVGPVANKARQIEQLLLDGERCELVVVAIPEELPVKETIELVRRASEVGMPRQTVVMNQVPTPGMVDDDLGLLDIMQQDGDEDLGRTAGAARNELESASQARELLAQLSAALDQPVLELPHCNAGDPEQCVAMLLRAMEESAALPPSPESYSVK